MSRKKKRILSDSLPDVRSIQKMSGTVDEKSQNCDKIFWRFFSWVDLGKNESEFDAHYQKLDAAGQAKCDERMRYLQVIPQHFWESPPQNPYAKRLKDERDAGCSKIWEIRFKANNKQQRPLGYFGPTNAQFTILVWSTHKERYEPPNYCDLCGERRQSIERGNGRIKPVEIA